MKSRPLTPKGNEKRKIKQIQIALQVLPSAIIPLTGTPTSCSLIGHSNLGLAVPCDLGHPVLEAKLAPGPAQFLCCGPRGRFLVLQSVVVWSAWVFVRPATAATVAAAATDTSCS